MRGLPVLLGACAVLVCGGAATQSKLKPETANGATLTPLILEKEEGERRIVRGWPGHPNLGESFILKVGPKNGGSSHLVFFTADLAPGRAIDAHRRPSSDEILYLQKGTARVHLGDSLRVVNAGATVFIPANTWISVDNIGNEGISLVGVFSAPGFEEFMRATSVRQGDKNVPLSKAENDQIEKMHRIDVIYK
ncbi:MAG: cupin domain-containing protein [Bryobacteraceae bacterium]